MIKNRRKKWAVSKDREETKVSRGCVRRGHREGTEVTVKEDTVGKTQTGITRVVTRHERAREGHWREDTAETGQGTVIFS